MTEFIDGKGRTYDVSVDAFTLKKLRDALGISDIPKLLATVESDEVAAVQAIHVLSRSGETFEQFAKSVTRDRLDEAAAAVVGAVTDFFPPNKWSVIRSRWESIQKQEEQINEVRPLLAMLDTLPESMRDAVMGAIAEKMEAMASTDSPGRQDESQSVSGQDATPRNDASDLPDSWEYTAVG